MHRSQTHVPRCRTDTELFGEEGRQRNSRLERTLDDLRGRFGKSAVKRGSELD